MRRRTATVAWSQTAEGYAFYLGARALMQAAANADGFDRGIEANDVMRIWTTFMLPRRENRRGFELRCEVVSCEDLAKCQPGHGPR